MFGYRILDYMLYIFLYVVREIASVVYIFSLVYFAQYILAKLGKYPRRCRSIRLTMYTTDSYTEGFISTYENLHEI